MMNPRRAIVVVTFGCLMSGNALAQTQPTCPQRFQPYANRCISQRMADYISCVEASGGNSERIATEVTNANAGKTDVGVKGSGSGVVVKGNGSVKVDRATEHALASKFEQTWTDKGMEQCRKVLDPPKSPTPRTTPHESAKENSSDKNAGNNQAPTVNAPNGIGIIGGTVTNPTVNNYINSAPPPRRLTDDERESLVSCLKIRTGTFVIGALANNGEAYRYALDFSEVFSAAGW